MCGLRGSSHFKLPETLLKVSEGLLERTIRKLLEALILELLDFKLTGESRAKLSSGRDFMKISRGSSRRLFLAALRGWSSRGVAAPSGVAVPLLLLLNMLLREIDGHGNVIRE